MTKIDKDLLKIQKAFEENANFKHGYEPAFIQKIQRYNPKTLKDIGAIIPTICFYTIGAELECRYTDLTFFMMGLGYKRLELEQTWDPSVHCLVFVADTVKNLEFYSKRW